MSTGYAARYLVANETVYTDWMPRQGDNLDIMAELIEDLGADIRIRVYHKDRDDTGNGTRAGTVEINMTTEETKSVAWTDGLKELVRLQCKSTGSAGDNALFRIIGYTWFDAVNGTVP